MLKPSLRLSSLPSTNESSKSSLSDAEPQPEYGILHFNPKNCKKPPIFKESLTIEAMRKVGITPDELVELNQYEKYKIPGDFNVKHQIIAELEKRRLDAVEQIKKAREELIEDIQRKNKLSSLFQPIEKKTVLNVSNEFDKSLRGQRCELERLIATEIIKQETRIKEQEREQRMSQMIQEREEIKKKKTENEKRIRLEKEEMFKERDRSREQELLEMLEKQKADDERRRLLSIKKDKIRKEEYEKQNAEREAKLKRFQDEMLRKEQENRKLWEEKDLLMKQREENFRKKKEGEWQKLKEKNWKLNQIQHERLIRTQTQQKLELEKKVLKLNEREENLQKRLKLQRKEKARALSEIRMKNEERYSRSMRIKMQNELENMKKKDVILIKSEKVNEKNQRMAKEREKRIEQSRLENAQRNLMGIEKKRINDELKQQKLMEWENNMAEKEVKFNEYKQKQEQDLINKNAFVWLRNRINEENARRLQRQREYEAEINLTDLDRRMQNAERVQKEKFSSLELMPIKEVELERRKHELMEEIEKLKGKGEDFDYKLIASKFGIDIEEVKRKFLITKGSSLSRPFTTSK